MEIFYWERTIYTLTCNILVASHLCPSVTYQWTNNNNTVTPLETLPNSISFSPLRLSDVGQYACWVIVSLFYLNNIINNATVIELHNLKLQSKSPLCYRQYENLSFCLKFLSNAIPAPISVTLTSTTPNPVQPIESVVNLTCIVHITDAVDIL